MTQSVKEEEQQAGAKQAYEPPAAVFVPNEPTASTSSKEDKKNPAACAACKPERVIQ